VLSTTAFLDPLFDILDKLNGLVFHDALNLINVRILATPMGVVVGQLVLVHEYVPDAVSEEVLDAVPEEVPDEVPEEVPESAALILVSLLVVHTAGMLVWTAVMLVLEM